MIKELQYNIFSNNELQNEIDKGHAFLLKAKRPVLVGTSCLLKVNTSIGVSEINCYESELKKLNDISKLSFRPDIMMDLSIVPLQKPLWKSMVEVFDGAVGTLPHYTPFDNNKGLSENDFFDNLNDMAKGGVSFVTLHPTADIALYKKSLNSQRTIPMTSRGGYVLLKDQIINQRDENIVAKNFDKIMRILHDNNVAVSIGSVFRPATIHEALDSIHREETYLQKKYIDLARKYGVSVQMEGIGHIPLHLIKEYVDMIRPFNTPLMPLGPMVSDEIVGFDHITNAIGAAALTSTGVVGVINSVTREEHTGRVPSYDSIVEGLKVARVVAHSYNISKFSEYRNATEVIGLKRSKHNTCVRSGGIFDYVSDTAESVSCTRCRRECPLKPIVDYSDK